MQNALIVDEFMTGAADVIEDLVTAVFLEGLADTRSEVIEHFVPRHAFPFALAACAYAAHWVRNALGIVDLVESRGPLGAIAPTATWMRRIAFELANTSALLVHVGKQSASRLAVETDRRNQSVVLCNLAGPLRRIVLGPVVPAMHGRKAGKTAGRHFEAGCGRIER